MRTKHHWAAFALAIAFPTYAEAGNGAPNGAHYNVNLIGVPKAELSTFLGATAPPATARPSSCRW